MFISAPDITSRSDVRFAAAILAPSLTASGRSGVAGHQLFVPISPTAG